MANIRKKLLLMKKLKIVQIPPGFAPEHIRKQWIGVEIPLAENPIPEGKEALRIGNDNAGGYQVKGTDAVKALRDAGKIEAADFWENYSSGMFKFKKEVCEVVS
jgi:hypothetical protein